MRPATFLLFALGSSVLAAPATDDLDLGRHAATADFEAVSGRHIPPPDPVLCAKRKAECQCSKIDKSTSEGFWEYYQCTTKFFCEWCRGLWRSPPGGGAAAV
ncbi:hypothetical protein D7B24_000239 [Verticillium nonalfalfae]|uniref:Uncharacterized protein n=1 Tax=Verticillium nonalfalfae TaxID=1051616 RepID=A0A3M9YI70_9PEZI|nr:uncharacterized protein D7B24_000239 [Verticillium nonalfalfae]RNJ60044.1 hypothetical protein D7B24_000239 [Verticillium nonalfalfae]